MLLLLFGPKSKKKQRRRKKKKENLLIYFSLNYVYDSLLLWLVYVRGKSRAW